MTSAVEARRSAGAWVTVLRVFAVLIGIRGLANFAKPFGFGTAFVLFGKMVTGTPGHVLAVLFGVYLVIYAWAAWRLRSFAAPMGLAYAVFVALNIPLFAVVNHVPSTLRIWVFGIVFLLVGVGVTGGAAYLLWTHRGELS